MYNKPQVGHLTFLTGALSIHLYSIVVVVQNRYLQELQI
jgi:hypothetical protein